MRIRAVLFAPILTAACAKLAGIDGFTVGDPPDPTYPGDARDGSGDEELVLDPKEGGGIDPGDANGPCLQPTNDRFSPLDARWVLRGAAIRTDAGIQLTPETATMVGQVYWNEPGLFDRFEVSFKFKITTTAASVAGDGIAFAWLEGETMTPIGDAGSNHGVYAKKGFAVVIDTYKNPGDPDTPDVSIRTTEAMVRIQASAALPALLDGNEHEAKVRLIGKDLTVSVDGRQALLAPVAAYVPYVGYASFSSGTGSAKSTHLLTEATLRIGSTGPCVAP